MHRHVTTFAVSVLALAAGACAARVVTAPPAPPPAQAPVAAPVPEEEDTAVATLPVRDLQLAQLLQPSLAPQEPAGCDLDEVVQETAEDQALKDAPLKAGTSLHRYVEVRSGAVWPAKDYEKDIALRVLDLETCTTQVITIRKTYGTRAIAMPVWTKKGKVWKDQVQAAALVRAPKGWDIVVVRRANGIEWNNWATDFRINAPAGHIVVGLKYPIVNDSPRKGESRIAAFTYVPHTEELLQSASLVRRGPAYGKALYGRAAALLRERGVRSKAMPELSVVDVPALTWEMSFRRMANEHMDQLETTLNPDWATRRIFMVIGANGDRFGSRTCSPAQACGSRQFIRGTWSTMRTAYPAAGLTADFTAGASDAVQATMASILLDDYNLAALQDAFGPSIAADPLLEEYLTAAYNTGVGRVIAVVRAARSKDMAEWTEARGKRCSKASRYAECLVPETKGYIAKLRYLKEEWPLDGDLALKN